MARLSQPPRDIKYPKLPLHRDSIVPITEDDTNREPHPWELSVSGLKKLPDKSLEKALEIINQVFQDYTTLVFKYQSIRKDV